ELVTGSARYQVAITGIVERNGERIAVLEAGDLRQEVPAGEVGLLWSGEYLALWRPPAQVEPPLLPGSRGPAVSWLREALGQALGTPIESADAQLYDEALAGLVREFQQ